MTRASEMSAEELLLVVMAAMREFNAPESAKDLAASAAAAAVREVVKCQSQSETSDTS